MKILVSHLNVVLIRNAKKLTEKQFVHAKRIISEFLQTADLNVLYIQIVLLIKRA